MADLISATIAPQDIIARLERIVAILVARTGNDRLEIGEYELMCLPARVEVTMWRNPAAWTNFVAVDLDLPTIARIQCFGERLAQEDVVDAEIVEPLAITAGSADGD